MIALAVLFDLDGVLVDSARAVARAWRRWAQARGVSETDTLALIHERIGRDVIAALTPHLDADAEAELVTGWEQLHGDELAIVPGAQECVAVARRGAWAVVTSGQRGLAVGRLQAVGLPVPPVIITADDVGRGKPDTEPYERAARELGVAAADCVVVEDAPAGITAAKRARMVVLAIATTHAAVALQDADHVFASMPDATDHLRRLKGADDR